MFILTVDYRDMVREYKYDDANKAVAMFEAERKYQSDFTQHPIKLVLSTSDGPQLSWERA